MVFNALQAQVMLKYNLKKGDSFVMEQKTLQTLSQSYLGITEEIETEITGTVLFKVVDHSTDTFKLDISFTSAHMKMSSSSSGVISESSSKSKDDTFENKIFRGLIGRVFTLTLDNRGKVLKMENGESLINGMLYALELTDEVQIKSFRNLMLKDWGESALADTFEQLFFNYPNGMIKEGDSWKNEFISKSEWNAQNHWRLDSVSDDSNTILCTADIFLETKNDSVEMKVSGTQETELIADSETGLPLIMKIISTAEGTNKAPSLPEFPITIVTKTIYKKL
ncbi:hypothetical protein KH5_19000 [Urechidicola sp. KH5]